MRNGSGNGTSHPTRPDDGGTGIALAAEMRSAIVPTVTLMKIRPELERQVDKLREPFAAFVSAQTTASGLLVIALVAALSMANLSADQYAHFRHLRVGLIVDDDTVAWSLLHLVNDGLIALFFLLIGLEVKRELLAGELKDGQRVRLLLGAALGGMVMPAAIYLIVNATIDGGQMHGWGIPMATDTALAIGVLAALGGRVPKPIVAFLIGLAIIDDIGAIAVIALFYTQQLLPGWLIVAALALSVLLVINRAGLRHPLPYLLGGTLVWWAIVQSGVHASIAGVVIAMSVPARPRLRATALKRRVRSVVSEVPSDAGPEQVLGEAHTHRQITKVERLAQDSTTPLRRWEDSLELPVALIVLPLFVFINAGIALSPDALRAALTDPVAVGVTLGLVIGKPGGILLGVWLGERLLGARRPPGLDNVRLLGIGLLAGVGFTMSTFIANLALGGAGESLATAKLAILLASAVAALAGYVGLRMKAGAGRLQDGALEHDR